MSLLAPFGLLALITVPLVLLFYLLRVRLRTTEIGSTYLWERLLRDLSAQDPWQHPRFTALMALQMLVLAVLALALARPAISAMALPPRFAVLVVDVSASMQATDVAPSRFENARQQAIETVRQIPDNSTASVIAAGSRPAVLAPPTSDKEVLVDALNQHGAEGTSLDLEAAVRLAMAVAAGQENAEVHIFTDGAHDGAAMAQDQRLQYHLVGGGNDNQAISELAIRADARNNRRHHLYLRLSNFADKERDVTVGLYADGNLFDSRAVKLPASGEEQLIVDSVPDGANALSAKLLEDDDLGIDNTAAVVIERRHATRVLLVSNSNLFLQRAIELLPNVELSGSTPAQFPGLAAEGYDLIVFDAYLPENLPRQNLLLVNPPNSAFLTVGSSISPVEITSWQADHPLLQYVSLSDLRVQRAVRVEPPGWMKTILEARGQPLLLAGEREGRRTVVVAFDLQQSNLPLLAAFPILAANTIGYLEPPDVIENRSIRTGEKVGIQPLRQADEIIVQRPDDNIDRFVPAQALAYLRANHAGIYTVRQLAQGNVVSSEQFAANLTDASESNIVPRLTPAPWKNADRGEQREPLQREIWQWVVVAGLALLGFEWWWYHRRA